MAKRSPVAIPRIQGNSLVAVETISEPKKPARGRSGTTGRVEIVAPRIQVVSVEVVGVTPLIVHAWSIKAIRQMLYKQMKISESGREAKDPQRDYEESRLISTDGWDGVPATSFKCALAEATRQVEGLTMTAAKRLIFVEPDGYSKVQVIKIPQTETNPPMEVPFGNTGLVRIYGEPRLRCDMVRIDNGSTADIRFRAEYKEWSANLQIRFNENVISAQQVFNLASLAGQSEGIGEWRPSAPKVMSGNYGRWRVVGVD